MAEELDKKAAEEISNLRKAEAEITKELISLRERLKILSSEDVVNLKEAANIQFKMLDLEKEKRGISKEIVDLNGKVFESDEKRQDISKSILDLQQDSVDFTKEMVKESENLIKESEKIKITQDSIVAIQKDINRYEIDIKKNKESGGSKAKEILKSSEAQLKLDGYITNTLETRKQLTEEAATANAQEQQKIYRLMKLNFETSALMSEVQNDIVAASEEAAKGSFKKLSTDREAVGLKNIEIDIQQAMAKGDQVALDFFMKQKEGLETIIAAKNEANMLNAKDAEMQKQIIEKQKEMKELVDGTGLNKVFDGVEGAVKKLPGSGVLLKTFGFDKMKDNIQQNLGNTLTSITTGFQQGGMAGFKAMIGGAKSFGMALISGPQAAIFGVLAVVGLIVAAFGDVDASISETQKSLGGTKKEAVAAYDASAKMSKEMKMVGVNAKEVVKNVAMLSESMGGVDLKKFMTSSGPAGKYVQGMVKDATLLTEKFGLSADEVDNVKTLSIMSGKSMATLAGEAIKVAGGAMGTKNAMKVLAGISKEVMVSFKGNTKELIAAAAKAKMLGTNLDNIKNSGMAMLDIESSLGKEMEARVLLGREINLDAARAAALEGDIPTLQEEILKNAGSLDEFQKSGPLKQKALADAMNMSVEEMTKMLTSAEEMNKLGLDKELQDKLANANAEEKAKMYDKQAKMLEAQGDTDAANLARQKAAQEESASLSEKLGDIFAKLKQSAEKIITPLVDMVHAMFDAENGGAGLIDVFDGIMSAIKPVFTILMGVGKLIFKSFMFPLKLVFALIQPIIDAIQEVFSVMDAGEQSGGGLSAVFEGIGKVMDFIHGTVIEIGKGLITMLITPAKLFWKAVISPIWDVFKGIGDTISKAFTPLQGATETGSKFGGIMDGIKSLFERFQPLITAVGKYFLSFILKPITLITEGISFIVKLFTGDFKGAAQSAGNILVEYFLGIPKKILGMVTGLIDGIFGTNLTGMLDKVFKWIKTTVGDVIFGVGGKIVDFIMAPFNILKDLFGGIIKMFTGDFEGGLEQIGNSIIDNVINIFLGIPKLIWGSIATVIDAVFGTKLTEQVDGFFNNITDVFKNIGGFIMDIGGSIFKFIMRPFDLAKGLINGIIQMFTGDFMGGLKTIGDAIMNFIMAPFNLVQELFNKFTGMFSGLGDKIKDAAKGMLDFLPDSLNPFAGGDEETAKAASAAGSEKKIGAAATGGTITKGGATLVGEKGPEVVSLPQGSVVANASATKQIGSAMNSMGGASPDGSSQSPELAVLQSIDAKIGSLLEPMQKVGEAIGSVVGSITSMASSLPGIGGVVSGISSFFGGGDEKGTSTATVQTTSVPQMAAQPATGMQSVQSPGATPDAGKAGKQGPDVVAEKLDKLIGIMSSIASQPTIIKFGEKTVEEISSTINLRKTYNVAVDNTYGRRV